MIIGGGEIVDCNDQRERAVLGCLIGQSQWKLASAMINGKLLWRW